MKEQEEEYQKIVDEKIKDDQNLKNLNGMTTSMLSYYWLKKILLT